MCVYARARVNVVLLLLLLLMMMMIMTTTLLLLLQMTATLLLVVVVVVVVLLLLLQMTATLSRSMDLNVREVAIMHRLELNKYTPGFLIFSPAVSPLPPEAERARGHQLNKHVHACVRHVHCLALNKSS